MTTLQALLVRLDVATTGADERDAEHMARNQEADFMSLTWRHGGDRCYYLSDGGYSRIAVNVMDDSYRPFLTSNSTDKAKANWIACEPLRMELQLLLRQLAIEAGYLPPA